jgi:hypothetical protein
MFVSRAVAPYLLQNTPHTYACRGAPPHRTWIELSATIDFMLTTWSATEPHGASTLPAIEAPAIKEAAN